MTNTERFTNPAIFSETLEGLKAHAITPKLVKECTWCEGSGIEFNEENKGRICPNCNGAGVYLVKNIYKGERK